MTIQHIALISDAWTPQINGVVRTLGEVLRALEEAGCMVRTITPDCFRSLPCPTYPEIRLAFAPRAVGRLLDAWRPDAVHIATEGPLGLAARAHCLKRGWPFTTSFHTKFPEYVQARFALPVAWGYRFLRWFHAPAARMLVATQSIARELEGYGFSNIHAWSRGVDTSLFHPDKRTDLGYARPVLLYVGRVAVEKNIEAFLTLPPLFTGEGWGGDSSFSYPPPMNEGSHTKLVVGDGPQRAALQAKYPDAVFVGAKHGEALARYYASADVLVFPSKTDTFGLVMLEALASGTPVAAYPVAGPLDVLTDPRAAAMAADLSSAVVQAAHKQRTDCRAFAQGFSWARCARQLYAALAPTAHGERCVGAPMTPQR